MYETELTDEPVVVKSTSPLKPLLAWDWPLVILLGLLALADVAFVALWTLPANRDTVGLAMCVVPLGMQVGLIYSLAARRRGARSYVIVYAVLAVTALWLMGDVLLGGSSVGGHHHHEDETVAEHAAHILPAMRLALTVHMISAPLLFLGAIVAAIMHRRK